jgi:hypothetical protein
LDETLIVAKDENGRLTVNDIPLVLKDIVATNGVLHVIDTLIIPASARPLEAVVKERTEKLLKVLGGGGDAAAVADRLAAKLADLKGQSLKNKK